MNEPRRIVTLPDGYNGATRRFFADPLEVDGALVKLGCADPGEEYLITWARRAEVEKRLEGER